MDLGPHAEFIWASYAITVLVVGGLAAWIITDGRRQKRLLDELERQGVTRRSARAGKSGYRENS